MVVLVFLFFVAVVYLVQYKFVRSSTFKDIPGPRRYPLIGNALLGIGAPEVIFAKLRKMSVNYPRFAAGKIGIYDLVFLFDPEDIEVVMSSKNLHKAREYEFLMPWMGQSLGLTKADARYKAHKKIILPAFRLQILKGFFDSFNSKSQLFIDTVMSNADTGKEVDIMDYLYSMQMSILLETQLGVDNKEIAEIGIKYGRATSGVCKVIHRRMYSLWMRPDFLFQFTNMKKEQDRYVNELRDITTKIINKKKAVMAQKSNEGSDNDSPAKKMVFLDVMLEASRTDKSLTDEDIRDEVMFMMFAGQDTSAITAAFAICLLGYYQDVQERVHSELDEVLGKSEEPRYISYDDTLKLKYLDAVLHETLRMFPSIPALGKTTEEDIFLKDGYRIPKNASIIIGIFKVHRHEKTFPDPEEFQPERFFNGSSNQRHPYSYIPFSIGQRACVGYHYSFLTMKVTLAKFFSLYKVTSDRHPLSYKLLAETTMKRKEGFPVYLHRRCERTN